MLNRVEARTDQGVLLSFPLGEITNGYLLYDIEGLDPVKATLVSSSFATLDGEQQQSSRREKRNIVIKMELKPDFSGQTVLELRNRLYGFFMPKSNVNFRFFGDGMPTVNISGTVESFDAPIFVKEPKATISILCFNPDFYDPDPVTVEGFTTNIAEDVLIEYEGTVESGFKFTLLPDRAMTEFTIYHRPLDGTIRSLEFVAPLSAGDVLEISTVSRAKGATLTRAGSISSILYGVSPYSNWINLVQGPNLIRVYDAGLPVPYTIEYTTKYGGL